MCLNKAIGLTHLVLHELGELSRVVPTVDDVLHEVLLLHLSELLNCVLVFVQRGTRHGHSIWVHVVLLFFVRLVYHCLNCLLI